MSDMIITVNILTEVIMSRLANIVVYEENKGILKNNGFYNDGKFIKLPYDLEKHRNVVVLSPNVIKEFAVYGRGKGEYNYRMFKEILGECEGGKVYNE